MHIHILGICGTFMGGLAAIAMEAGHRVSGSDANVYPPMSEQLRSLGVRLVEGYAAEQAGIRPDLWVIGNVVTRGNPLMEAILDRGDRYVSGPEWLADTVLSGRTVLSVAGTHGKTTTTSMLAWILEDAGLEPGFLIGGVPLNFGTSARLGFGKHFVVEADEYDTAFFDKRSKMVHYRTRVGIITNIEFDHADIFADLAAIETQFHHFVRTIPKSGVLIVNGADQATSRVLDRGCWTPVERFGVREGWNIEPADTDRVHVRFGEQRLGELQWQLLGDHNRLNALAALAAARAAGVEPSVALASLKRFSSVKRRMELHGTVGGVSIWDDFAHHPTAIGATLSGLRSEVGAARILAVLEPRSNTMKAGVMKGALPQSLAKADSIFCYTADLSWNANEVLQPLADRVCCDDDIDRLVAAIAARAQPGDHVLVMSNGAFGGIQDRLLRALAARVPAGRPG